MARKTAKAAAASPKKATKAMKHHAMKAMKAMKVRRLRSQLKTTKSAECKVRKYLMNGGDEKVANAMLKSDKMMISAFFNSADGRKLLAFRNALKRKLH